MIVLARRHVNRGIRRAVLHVMIGRVGVERLELVGIFDRAELGDVEGAVGIELDAQHVVDADLGNHGAEQVRTLREGRAHQQAAVAAAENREMRGRGVFLVDQILRAGQEVVEHILLVRKIAGAGAILRRIRRRREDWRRRRRRPGRATCARSEPRKYGCSLMP